MKATVKQRIQKYKLAEIKAMLQTGKLLDIKKASHDGTVNTYGLTQIGFNAGLYGCNAEIYKDNATGQLYLYQLKK